MFLRRVCCLMVAGVVAAFVGRAAGDDCCSPCAPTTCKVRCIEMVSEQVPVTRTTYKRECREEPCTAYRCEMVPETRTCNRTVYKKVCETVMETRTCCVRVPVTEQRTCYKTCWKTVSVTETRKVSVDRGHWECQTCEAPPSILDRLHHKKDCCEPCPRTITKKVWVPCVVCEDRCVTCCKRVCEQVPYTTCVTTCKLESRTTTVPVTRVRCVPEQVCETHTVCVKKMIPYQTVRKVSVCVPVCETVMCCRMVPRCVEKEVAVASSCGCNTCNTCNTCTNHRGLFAKRHHEGCCGASACCN